MSWDPNDPFADSLLFGGSFPMFGQPQPFVVLPPSLVFNEDGLIVRRADVEAPPAVPPAYDPPAYDPPPLRESPAELGPAVTYGDLRMPGDYLPPSDVGTVVDPGRLLFPGFGTEPIDFAVGPVVSGRDVVSTATTEASTVSIWTQLGQQLLGGLVGGLGSSLVDALDDDGGGFPSLPGAGTGFQTGGYLEQGMGGRRRRRMDPCNSRALMRAARRLTMYANMNRKVDKALRKAIPARLRGHSTRKGKR